MKIMKNKKYSFKDHQVIDEEKFMNRRTLMFGAFSSAIALTQKKSLANALNKEFNNIPNREKTDYDIITKYNNFFEFGTSKQIWKAAQKLSLDNWKLEVEGGKFDKKFIYFDDLVKKFSVEERIYKFRCVETWSMVVPWNGFPLADLISFLEPESSTKFVLFETFFKPKQARNQKQKWYPWPYTEIITIKEALNPLSFLATGVYGKQLPKQNGAPLRLILPWKYGFKSIKSIVKIKFLKSRVPSFWQEIAPDEYGFWANVNPAVPHRRWSQAFEKDIGTGKKYPTEIFNGYGEWVEDLYSDKSNNRLFF